MSNRDNNTPETPANWGEYSRMLGDLPLRSIPQGADARLSLRLESETASPRPSRPWLAGALSIAAGTVAIVAGLSIFSTGNAPMTVEPSRPSVEAARAPRGRKPKARVSNRMIPHITTSPMVDTTPPTDLPHTQRIPDATTGGDRASRPSAVVPGVPPRQRPTAP